MRWSTASRYTLALLATLSAAQAVAQEVDIRAATVDGVTHGWSSTGLGAPADGVVLGQPISEWNGAPTMVRHDGAGNIRLQSSADGQVPSTRVDLLAIAGDLRALGIPAEIGAVEMDHSDQQIVFEQPFARTPVVFTSQATFRGAQPAYTFAAQVTPSDALLRLREPMGWDGWHAVETVRYLAIEPGTYLLPDGRVLTVDRFPTHVGQGYPSRAVWPEVALRDDAVVVGTVQNTASQAPALTISRADDQGALSAFEMRQHNFGDATSYNVEAGYLVLGARAEPATVTLLGSGPGASEWERVQTGASIEYLTEPNNTCYTLADFGMDHIERAELVGAGTDRTTLALFEGPRCTGRAATVEAARFDQGVGDPWAMQQLGAVRSFRVVWADTAEAPMRQGDCFAPGETIVDNGPAVFRFTAEGDLVLARRNPSTGGETVSWAAGIEADALCLQAPMHVFGRSQLVATRQGGAVWSVDVQQGHEPTRLALTEQCTLELRQGEWSVTPIGGEPGCHLGLPAPVPDPTPTPKLIFGDVDGDADPEMVLMLTKADGSGHLMYDPLGVADFFFVVGLPPDADFIGALSQTQRQTLQHQTRDVVPGGVTTIAQLLELLERMHASRVQHNIFGQPMGGGQRVASLYRTFEFEVAVDVSAVEAEAEWNGFQADASVGNFEFEMHNDADSFGVEMSASAAEASASYDGYITVEASVLSAEAGMYVGNDGVAVGGGADLVAVTLTAGRQDRTHIGISAGVGVGFWAEARWGRDDLYGFTLDLPIFPVGVAIYVRGDDVRWLGAQVVTLVDSGLYEGEQLGRMVWRESSTWAVGAYGDASVFMSETWNETRSFVEKTANGALVGVEDGVQSVTVWVEGAGWELQNTVDAVGSTIENYAQQGLSAVEGAADDAGNWVEGAANDAGNWIGGAVDTVGNFFGGLF